MSRSKTRFYDDGPYKGCDSYRWISIGGKKHFAKKRQTLQFGLRRPRPVFVVSGRALLSCLSESKKQRLRSFSGQLSSLAQELGSLFVAYKHRLDARQLPRAAVAVAWNFGPIPAVVVGRVGGVDVCATPVAHKDGARQLGLFQERTGDSLVYLELLAEHFSACMEEYFTDIGSVLKNAFLVKDKRKAGDVARHIERILSESVRSKIRDLTSASSKSSADANEVREKVASQLEDEIAFYDCAAAVVESAIAALRWVSGGDSNWRAALGAAQERFASVDLEGHPEMEPLQSLLQQLSSEHRTDDLAALTPRSGTSKPWLDDLGFAFSLLANLLNLAGREEERDKVHVFVTHHMDVFAAEEFYRQLRDSVRAKWGDAARVWTGYGRQKHIQLSILAKIWLSEVQVVYLPNSLDTRQGGPKDLSASGDWVVEEMFYGAATSKDVHLVLAENSGVLDRVSRQLSRYDWDSLDPLISVESRAAQGRGLRESLQRHLKQRIYTAHRPTRKPGAEFQKLILKAIMYPGLIRKLKDHVEYLHGGLEYFDVQVVRAIARARGIRAQFSLTEALAISRKAGIRRGRSWLRRALQKRLIRPSVTIRGEHVHIVRAVGRGRYQFDFMRLADVYSDYCPSVDIADLRRVVVDAMGVRWPE